MSRKIFSLLGQYLLLLFLVITINFFIVYLAPGNPVDVIVRGRGDLLPNVVTDTEKQALRQYYGLDRPLAAQYFGYLSHLAHGDLGYSFFYHRPVAEIILDHAKRTLPVVAAGMALALLIGLPLGMLSASHRGKRLDTTLLIAQVSFHSLPPFFIATILLVVFAVKLKWFPFSGSTSVSVLPESRLGYFGMALYHLTLPVIALALWESTTIFYFTRNSLIDILSEDFILVARAKGLSERSIFIQHALRAALPTLVTRFALVFGFMLGGVFFVEQVFSYPGIAMLALSAFNNYDYLLLRGVFLLLALGILIANLFADICVFKLDPRVGAS